MAMVKVVVGGLSAVVETAQALAKAEELREKVGADAPLPTFEPAVSEFGEGNQVMDLEAKARIEATHAALTAAGVHVDTSKQLYETGTRMAAVGYETQARRKAAFEMREPAEKVIAQGSLAIRGEGREDHEHSALELAHALSANGVVRAFGLELREQAIRGLLGRLESPGLGYVLGLLKRAKAGDIAKVADVLEHECRARPDTKLKLRCRGGLRDVFAIVSPSYEPADFPQVAGQLIAALPDGAKGSFEYDAVTTEWSTKLDVWTPTPIDEQAVGEPFTGYVGIGSRDNGTSRLRGDGGVGMIACLNASTYNAAGVEVNRVHRGGILADVERLIEKSKGAINALCQAWGRNREVEIPTPEGLALSRELTAMMFRGLLTDRRSEFVGVLPGRTEKHVEQLAETFDEQRRDQARLVRSDVAQAWTRYAQEFPMGVQREAERAAGQWLVAGGPVTFEAE